MRRLFFLFLMMVFEFFLSLVNGINAYEAVTTNRPWWFALSLGLSWLMWREAAMKFVFFRQVLKV